MIDAVAERRPVPEDGAHDRGPAGQGRVRPHRHHGQRDGRPALVVRRRGHARRPRGGHRRQARRPGRGQGRLGHVARPHRQRELHGGQPHRPRCARSPRSPPPSPTATCPRRSPSTRAARCSSSRTRSTRWSTSCRRSPTRSRASRARSARRASSAARPRSRASSGTWRDLTESVNVMASNLTDQVRQIAEVTTAVANGDLTQKVTVEAKGEVAALAETINSMTDTLRVVRRAGHRRGARGRAPRACSAARPTCPASPARGRT